ncbi:Cyclin, N-terminal domain containing protein [Trichomonas vaginalis G3]|uniref:Cyclin, N-terminal domain containing protein n=1 Tax=Trichomonas vaginalis (strain ATCC PRA-98 / G3) TaxID=412133 RepID=A2FX51_TRIV3|nr:cyclin family [Trichomonas vaginalis G3]EAX90529.1 Cyclin, N-terminal domain containing protein [Trichomonas vaginalis G3]KAI5483792.1 cyclin family [Trichomonas vaginalis G3]|eukprot:XP_001303459.1 Cyclin, N-terminal domain containing protein [Trichomonas vaginalis G3]
MSKDGTNPSGSGPSVASTSNGNSTCEYSDDATIEIDDNEQIYVESPAHFVQKGMESIGELEIKKAPNTIMSADDFKKFQPDLTFHNRQIVVEWMYRVAKKISLPSEVLYSSISLLDKVLTSYTVPKDDVQLTAITCLWIQNKMDERHRHHKLALYAAVCQNAFQPIDFEKKEIEIVSFFGGQVEFQTAFNIIKILLDEINFTHKLRFVQFYYDVSLLSFRFNELPVTATAVIAINCALQNDCPLKTLCQKCKLIEEDVINESIFLNKVSQTVVSGKECGIYVEYCSKDDKVMENLLDGVKYFEKYQKSESNS